MTGARTLELEIYAIFQSEASSHEIPKKQGTVTMLSMQESGAGGGGGAALLVRTAQGAEKLGRAKPWV